jgi:hypothetical protein
MKHFKTFESFMNEGKDWNELNVDGLAKAFAKEFPDKNSNAEDLEYWVDQYCMEKKIENGPSEYDIEDLISKLQKMGYKKLILKDYPKPYYW